MSVVNTAPAVDVRKVMSGKDGAIFDDEGNMLVTSESFQSQVSITNQTFQPIGSAQERSAMTSYKVTLSISEIIIQDSSFFQMIMEGLKNHKMPTFNFRGMVRSPYDNSEEQIVYRDCVPDGAIDLQNVQPGELCKRTWNFVVNQPPELQSLLQNQ